MVSKTLRAVEDHEGWSYGIKAALKLVFGTDTELRLRHGGMEEEVANAKAEVGRMAQGAEELLSAMSSGIDDLPEVDEATQVLEDVIKDL